MEVTLGLALLAGALAAFNPCGFVMLPAYLALMVNDSKTQHNRAGKILRALRSTGLMTLGFSVVFGLFALIIAPLTFAIEPYLPYVTVIIGAVLMIVGARVLMGKELGLSIMGRRSISPQRGLWSQFGYGVTYALASLSCTIGPFLAVLSSALRVGGNFSVVLAMLTYALGMGAVVGLIAVMVAALTATNARNATNRMKKFLFLVPKLSGILLLLVGAYVTWYGWFEIRAFDSLGLDDPIINAAITVQSTITRVLTSLGAIGVTIIAALVGVVTAATAVIKKQRSVAVHADQESQ